MTQPDQALRFAIADATAAAKRSGLVIANNGGPGVVRGDAAVRQAVVLLLRTRPGERVMRPDYGCNLNRLIFAPNDHTTAGLAMHYVREAINRWEPRVKIVRLDAGAADDRPDVLEISLQYNVIATQSIDHLTMRLGLTGESV